MKHPFGFATKTVLIQPLKGYNKIARVIECASLTFILRRRYHGNEKEKIHNDVWKLFEIAVQQFGVLPTVIEWDNDIPEFNVLLNESDKAKTILSLNHVTA